MTFYSVESLSRMTVPTLKSVCEKIGINEIEKKKADIIKQILVHVADEHSLLDPSGEDETEVWGDIPDFMIALQGALDDSDSREGQSLEVNFSTSPTSAEVDLPEAKQSPMPGEQEAGPSGPIDAPTAGRPMPDPGEFSALAATPEGPAAVKGDAESKEPPVSIHSPSPPAVAVTAGGTDIPSPPLASTLQSPSAVTIATATAVTDNENKPVSDTGGDRVTISTASAVAETRAHAVISPIAVASSVQTESIRAGTTGTPAASCPKGESEINVGSNPLDLSTLVGHQLLDAVKRDWWYRERNSVLLLHPFALPADLELPVLRKLTGGAVSQCFGRAGSVSYGKFFFATPMAARSMLSECLLELPDDRSLEIEFYSRIDCDGQERESIKHNGHSMNPKTVKLLRNLVILENVPSTFTDDHIKELFPTSNFGFCVHSTDDKQRVHVFFDSDAELRSAVKSDLVWKGTKITAVVMSDQTAANDIKRQKKKRDEAHAKKLNKFEEKARKRNEEIQGIHDKIAELRASQIDGLTRIDQLKVENSKIVGQIEKEKREWKRIENEIGLLVKKVEKSPTMVVQSSASRHVLTSPATGEKRPASGETASKPPPTDSSQDAEGKLSKKQPQPKQQKFVKSGKPDQRNRPAAKQPRQELWRRYQGPHVGVAEPFRKRSRVVSGDESFHWRAPPGLSGPREEEPPRLPMSGAPPFGFEAQRQQLFHQEQELSRQWKLLEQQRAEVAAEMFEQRRHAEPAPVSPDFPKPQFQQQQQQRQQVPQLMQMQQQGPPPVFQELVLTDSDLRSHFPPIASSAPAATDGKTVSGRLARKRINKRLRRTAAGSTRGGAAADSTGGGAHYQNPLVSKGSNRPQSDSGADRLRSVGDGFQPQNRYAAAAGGGHWAPPQAGSGGGGGGAVEGESTVWRSPDALFGGPVYPPGHQADFSIGGGSDGDQFHSLHREFSADEGDRFSRPGHGY